MMHNCQLSLVFGASSLHAANLSSPSTFFIDGRQKDSQLDLIAVSISSNTCSCLILFGHNKEPQLILYIIGSSFPSQQKNSWASLQEVAGSCHIELGILGLVHFWSIGCPTPTKPLPTCRSFSSPVTGNNSSFHSVVRILAKQHCSKYV